MSDVEQWEHDEQRAMGTEIISLREQVEKLTKELSVLKTTPPHLRQDLHCVASDLSAQVRERDEQLTAALAACEKMQEQLAALAEQNEKQRAFLEFAWKDIPMNEYAFKILEHVMNLPNLADPALNRIRAVGMRMAAQFIEDKYDFLGEEITVADEILAKADELSKGETR